MRSVFALNSAKLAVLFSLVFACGCQNDLVSTESVQPESVQPGRVSQSTPVKARALSISEEIAIDQVVTEELRKVNWESDSFDNGNNNAPPNLDEVFNLESNDLGKLTEDVSETESFLE